MNYNPTYDIITIGGGVRDYLAITSEDQIIPDTREPTKKLLAFEFGAKIVISELASCLGGGACNVAVGTSRLGLRVAALANLSADDDGQWAAKILKKEKVETSLLSFDKLLPIGFSFVIIDKAKGDHTLFSYRGANDNLKIKLPAKIGAHWLYLASLSGKNWPKQLLQVTQICQAQKIKLAFNPGALQIEAGLAKLKNILKLTQVLLVNKSEATKLVQSKTPRISKRENLSVKDLLRTLYSFGPKIVVITEGKAGAQAYDGKRVLSSPARVNIKVVDTTGAGDAFSSGFLTSLIFQKLLPRALENGIKNGESVITKIGAQAGLLYKKDLFNV
jgi:fructokinase